MTDDGPTGGAWERRPRPHSRAAVVIGCILFVLLGIVIASAVYPGLLDPFYIR
jgi:hypothetical protein